MKSTKGIEGEKLNEDAVDGTLTVEQFWAILLEGIQKGVKKALKNLFGKIENQHLDLESKAELELKGQSLKDEQQKEQNVEEAREKVLEKTQTLSSMSKIMLNKGLVKEHKNTLPHKEREEEEWEKRGKVPKGKEKSFVWKIRNAYNSVDSFWKKTREECLVIELNTFREFRLVEIIAKKKKVISRKKN
ncbi:UNVERIFIED_CONTAM: hypothetical protein K2H54_015641 [Gekko kuhli]